MIVVRLMGGLGNQMFQYAMARSLADDIGVPLKLDITDFENNILRRFELNDFSIRAEIAGKGDLESYGIHLNRDTLWQRMKKRLPFLASNIIYREKSLPYDDRVRNITPPIYLDGYWQTERYFNDNAAAIRGDFTLRFPLDNANLEILRNIEDNNAVSLHVRRGDYVNNAHTNKYHGICSINYYRDSVANLSNRIKNLHLFVFSDDPEWAISNLDFGCPVTFVTLNSDKNGIFDMMLMRRCKHHIIANSSFSWWGAWLNPSPNKIVVAPRQWFRKLHLDTSDLIPSTWVLM